MRIYSVKLNNKKGNIQIGTADIKNTLHDAISYAQQQLKRSKYHHATVKLWTVENGTNVFMPIVSVLKS